MSETSRPDGAEHDLRTLAAVDLGSNSFHMVVARVEDGSVQIVDRLREAVRLGMGIKADGTLGRGARKRALACLERFGQRIRDLPAVAVRAVGTNTMRRVKDGGRFVEQAMAALGHRIDVISGQEEARLIYLGVAHDVQAPGSRRLVADIGGGSTEIILGDGASLERAHSLHMGCVRFTRRYFRDGRITPKAWRRARTQARLELEPLKRKLRKAGWDHALGASGTIRAVAKLAQHLGVDRTGLTREGMLAVREALLAAGHIDALPDGGVPVDRRPVLAGGAVILEAIFRDLHVERFQLSNGALREGALLDLLGRVRHEDVRHQTVEAMLRRFGVDPAQGRRVERTALDLLEQVFADWSLHGGTISDLLRWSARLHEVGLAVNQSGRHKHGAYLIANTNMPGFGRGDQALLAALVRSYRRKIDRQGLLELPVRHESTVKRLIVLLRLAARLHRSRSDRPLPRLQAKAKGETLTLTFPAAWLKDHPLTRADLRDEEERLAEIGIVLRVRSADA